MTRLTLLAACLLSATGCKRDRDAPPTAPEPDLHPSSIDITDPTTCQPCHAAIVEEWRESMHARSHHSRDPIYAGVRALRVKKEGAGITKACARCHTPGFEADPEAAAAAVGVACASCHHALLGAKPGQLLGPNDVAPGASPVHGTGPRHDSLADGTTICLTCHAVLSTPSGLSMCATGDEHAAVEGRQPCASCHMPRIPGAATVSSLRTDHASHAFLGPHRAWDRDDPSFVATAIATTAVFSSGTLRFEITNQSGHSFPTGFPGRQAIVECVGRDHTGAEVWRCEPQVLGKVYVDAEGTPTLAPFAVRLASDTRLAAGAALSFQAEPPAGVATVDVIVSMRLVPPSLAAKLGLADAPEGLAKPISTITATRAAVP